MKRMLFCLSTCCLLLVSTGLCLAQAIPQITVDVGKLGEEISPTMWGIFFEDINFGADGGLYAELVKNRSFEFPDAWMGWTQTARRGANGILSIRNGSPLNPFNPRYLRIEVKRPGDGFGVTNEGFRGTGIRKADKYIFSVYARSLLGPMTLMVQIVGATGKTLAEARISEIKNGWKNYHVVMTASDTDPNAELAVLALVPGLVDLDMISLFPEDSAVQSVTDPRPIPGLRKGIVEHLAALKPGFLRFPGGCIVEGRDLDNRYRWKNTSGDINQRKLIENRWNTEFAHRPTPDYFQTFGLGFYEFFVLSERIGAEPLPILNCGMACQFNTAQLVPMDQLQPYVQDALDLLEFANGPADSPWGNKRAEMGHPAPFNIKMLGVGNEQWGPQYIERYKVFVKALKDKYPDVKLIGGMGSDPAIFPNGPNEVAYLRAELTKLNADIIDEHFYRKPEWFIDNSNLYDGYDRSSSPKIFVGEYAAQSGGVADPNNRNNWQCALAEAAFMTGLERNADLVVMSCYAPLFGNENAWQWRPDLIWFDNLTVYDSANYYVQQLFSLNRGDNMLPIAVANPPQREGGKPGLLASSCYGKAGNEVIVKVVNVLDSAADATVALQGVTKVGPTVTTTVLTSAKLTDENSLKEPKKISPVTSMENIETPTFKYSFKPYSLTVLRLPVTR
jgi:alpha-N-arabinofuranosidase